MTQPPSNLTLSQRIFWLHAARDGFTCATTGGFQEQNPYALESPLFEAWRSGWFDGIDSMSETEIKLFSKPKNLQRVLSTNWNLILSRSL